MDHPSIPPAALPIRIVLSDTHAMVRTGLRLLLDQQPGLLVVGEAKHGGEALAVAAQAHPDIILLSLNHTDRSGLDLIPALLTAAAGARVLVLLEVRDLEVQWRAVRLGARGVVLKEHAAEVVVNAIAKVHAGAAWLDRALPASVLTDLVRGRAAPAMDPPAAAIALLTKREWEVIRLVSEGRTNRHIAARLSISEATVRHHLTAIFSKLDVGDRFELVSYAYRYGLVTPPATAILLGSVFLTIFRLK